MESPPARLAEIAAEIAPVVERAVYLDGKRADRVLSTELKRRHGLSTADHRFLSQAVFALFRWRGWVDPLGLTRIEARLLVSVLLDESKLPAPCRVWAKALGVEPNRVFALGDAPDWPARAEGFRRLLDGQQVTTDPWQLFPSWIKEVIAVPPGDSAPKHRLVGFLQDLQHRPPLWARAQQADHEALWNELREQGAKPWVHRKLQRAARFEADVDVYHLPAFQRGALEIQDLASQAVALACDPDPGERWWDACAGAGGKALHLADLMLGKGLVVATDIHASKLKETVRRARRGPHSNITTRLWDGKKVAGKPRSFQGVLVDAPCSALGTWRRNPDARWTLKREDIDRLAKLQLQLLQAAAEGVAPGGTLVYSVCTPTNAETTDVVQAFLEANPTFQLEPFPHPLEEGLTNGTLLIWPRPADNDVMFIARMVRSTSADTDVSPAT